MGKSIGNFPWWQRWWSYLSPVRIEAVDSDVNDNLELLLVRGRMQLCTANAVYSYENRYENFRQTFQKLELSGLEGGKVLVLGLGLGSIVQMLEEQQKEYDYTVVELDEDVIYLAEKYVLSKLNAKVQTICSSGEAFCQNTLDKYDLVCMDIFIDDWIPDGCLTLPFCQSLKSLLNERGLVIFNTPAFDKKSARNSKLFFKNRFLRVFKDAHLLDVHKNYMLLSDKHLLRE